MFVLLCFDIPVDSACGALFGDLRISIRHVAYHGEGIETKDSSGGRRTLLFADRHGGPTRPDLPIQVPGETLAPSSVNAPTLTAVTRHLRPVYLEILHA